MTDELKDIIARSYQLFKKYKVKSPLDVCTDCCLTKSQESELVSLPVNQIPFELLYEYNNAAKTTHPSIEEFKHFLPRFLELTAELKFLHHSAELTLSRFEYYSIDEWTVEELDLIQEYAEKLFLHILSVYPLPELEKIDSIIIMLYKAKVDIIKLLQSWSSIKTESSILHLSDLVCNGFKGMDNNILSSGFADKRISEVTHDWLNNDYQLANLKPVFEELLMNPRNLDEWKLNELNWTYEKLHKLDYKGGKTRPNTEP
ncbi:MAG: hypothetical protein CMP59_08200 [Flavobacteriales bacterium]|nr:hypothetical protein [Flavobacteriales bacterium]